MKLFKKRIKGNNKGFSLVELVCAVAIFGVATTAIGSAMVVSAQSYSRGTYEVDVQEEAQTATNIVGNLIFDAVSAKQVGNVVTIDGEGITYTITHNTSTGTLEYAEYNGATPATGVLAENVTAFSTNLSENPDDFKADRNVKVEITIEKNGRTYEASYNTTARNGSANAVGVAESATISVDSTVVIEPNQVNLELPVKVIASVPDRTFTVSKANASDPITVSSEMDCVKITASAEAEGPYVIIIQTRAKDDSNVPLDTKMVTVNVRRILGMNYTKNVTGSEGASGSSYQINFSYAGINLEKVYGRDYDTDYVDPKQFEFSYTSTSGISNVNDYIDAKVEQTGASPSVSFTLKNTIPDGQKIYITCTSLHSKGKDKDDNKTNKTGNSYGVISKTVEIGKSPITANGEITRGMDGNVQISIASSLMQQVRDNNVGCTVRKVIEVYEANIDDAGNFTKKNATPSFTYESIDNGNDTHIRAVDSKRMIPDQAYIIVVRVEAYKIEDGHEVIKWPTADNDPSEYLREFPLNPISVTYNSYGGHAGTATDPYKLTKGTAYMDVSFNAVGLDMSKGWRNALAWKVEKYNGSAWVTASVDEIGLMGGEANGYGVMKLKCNTEGHYRLLTWMDNITYRNYTDTGDVTGDFNFYDVNTGAGIVYIDFQ